MFKFTRSLCVALAAALVAPAFAAEWMTDLEAAKAKAAAEGKAVLVDFTGSDWCGFCIRLRKDVLDKPAFAEYAKDKFVLMEVDLPHNPAADQEMLKRNNELCEKYHVSGFPTVMVLTPEGHVAGGFAGAPTTLEGVAEPLDAALATIPAIKAAEALEGEAKLKALHAIYKEMDRDLRGSLRDRLAEMDVNNVTGIQDEIKAMKQMRDIQVQLVKATNAGADGHVMLAIVEAGLKEACPENLAKLLQFKVGIQLSLAETVEDVQAAKETLLQMAEADPANAEAIRAAAEQQFADPQKLLETVKARRANKK